MFERIFNLTAHGTTVRREVVAGITTFLTMAYIIMLNPQILHQGGLPEDAVFVATCLATAITTLIMGFYAKLPVALAPGMGLNAFFAFSVMPVLNFDWQLALGCVFLSGVLFMLISITPAREWLINSIPRSLKLSIAAGIGFFLALIGMYNAGMVVSNGSTSLVKAGNLGSTEVLLAAAGFAIIFALAYRRVIGAVLIGIVLVTLGAIAFGAQNPPESVTGFIPSMAPTWLQMHFEGGATEGVVVSTVLVFLLVVMLDTSGTLTAVAYQGNLLDEKGRLPNVRRALTTDAFGTMLGAALGTSPVTAYIESSAGIQAGGRTGLTAVVVGVLFLLCLFFSPLARAVPACATAPALLFVAVLMVKGLKEIDWDDLTEAAPALMTALAIPFTYSIASGIGIGFISYVAIKAITGRWRDLNFAVVIIALAFAGKIILDYQNFEGPHPG